MDHCTVILLRILLAVALALVMLHIIARGRD
jgi:hypothetical protein